MGYVVRPGDIVKSKEHTYTVLKELNKGGFADAYKARTEDGETVFFKQYKSPTKLVPWFKSYFSYEKTLNDRLHNDPVLKTASVYANETFLAKPMKPNGYNYWTRNECLFQTFPFITGNLTLADLIKKDFKEYDWEKRLYACTVFAFALRKLHDANVVHCDLKPENVQIKYDEKIAIKYRPLLIDMDWSILSDKTPPWNGYQGYVGTVGYNSPEHLKNQIPLEASDVFTAAIIICEVLAAKHPFFSHLGKDDFTKYVLSGKNDFGKTVPFRGPVTQKFNDLLIAALDIDPKKRPTMTEIHVEMMSMCKNFGKPMTIVKAAEPIAPAHDPCSIVNSIKRFASSVFCKKAPTRLPTPVPAKAEVEEPEIKKIVHKPTIDEIKKSVLSTTSSRSKLTLKGDIGQFTTKTNFIIDSQMLKRVTSESKYADSTCQFTVIFKEDNWYVKSNVAANNFTARNGIGINDSNLYLIATGDVLSVKGKSSGKTAMKLAVSID